MNPKLQKILIIIGLISIVVIGILVIPRMISTYYQISGGQQVEYVIKSVENVPDLVMTCEALPKRKQNLKQDLNEAIFKLNRAVRINSNNAQAYYYLGKTHCLMGEPDRAKENFIQYTQLKPDNPLGYIELGFTYERLEDLGAAKHAWEAAELKVKDFYEAGDEAFEADRYNDSIEWYERAILINPDWAKSWVGLGEAFDELGQPKKALDAFLEAWKHDPELSTAYLVNAYREKGNFIAVEELLEHMLEKFSDSSDRMLWYRELGDSYRGHGEYDQAIDVFSLALNEFTNEPSLHLTLGWIYFDQGEDNQQAIREFEKTISLDETNAEGYYGLARVFSREEHYQEADHYFQEAIRQSPNNRSYYMSRGNNALGAGNPEHAIEIYNRVLEINPEFAFGYYQLAQAYLMDDKYDESVDAIEIAVSIKIPPADSFYARAGNIYRATGSYEKAINAYRLALSLNPDNELAIRGMNLLEGD